MSRCASRPPMVNDRGELKLARCWTVLDGLLQHFSYRHRLLTIHWWVNGKSHVIWNQPICYLIRCDFFRVCLSCKVWMLLAVLLYIYSPTRSQIRHKGAYSNLLLAASHILFQFRFPIQGQIVYTLAPWPLKHFVRGQHRFRHSASSESHEDYLSVVIVDRR